MTTAAEWSFTVKNETENDLSHKMQFPSKNDLLPIVNRSVIRQRSKLSLDYKQSVTDWLIKLQVIYKPLWNLSFAVSVNLDSSLNPVVLTEETRNELGIQH